MKPLRRKFYLVLLASVTLYCSKKDSDVNDKSFTKELCVTSFFSINYNYFFNPDQLQQTEENINCVAENLSVAESFLRSKKRSMSVEDFQSWLNQTYFLKNPISSQHIASWFLFKRWVVGGESKSITIEELQQIKKILSYWKLFIKKINLDLVNIVKVDGNDSLKGLRKAYENLFKKMDDFLPHFPNLISNFEYEGFVTLLFNNKMYHNISRHDINPALIRALIWFANGQESTILSKNTTQFMLLTHYQYFKFRRQIGDQWESLIYKNADFIDYGIDLLEDLDQWLKKVKVLDYKGFKYLSNYISTEIFSERYTSNQVYTFIKTLNEKYLSEDINKSASGFGAEQLHSVLKMLESYKDFDRNIGDHLREPNNSDWVTGFIRTHFSQPHYLILSDAGMFDIGDKKIFDDKELLRLVRFISMPLSRIMHAKASFYVRSLTKNEFLEVLDDFKIFENLWKVEGIEDYYEYARLLGPNEQFTINQGQLFFLVTQQIQSFEFKDFLKESSAEANSLDHLE